MEKLKNFIENPNEETFHLVEISSNALNEVLKHAPQLADRFFQFHHWYRIYRETNNSPLILNKMRDAVKTFDDSLKYHYILRYDDRMAHETELIKIANTVKELTSLLHLFGGNKHRKEIIEKMKKVAISDEEKETVSLYKI